MSVLLLVASVVCFLIALLIDVSVVASGNAAAWLAGGLLAYALSVLVGAYPMIGPRA